MLTEKFKKIPLVITLGILAILTIAGYSYVRSHVLSRVIEKDGYISFTALVDYTKEITCEEDLLQMTDKPICTQVDFIDPTTKRTSSLSVSTNNYQVRDGVAIENGDLIRINKVEGDDTVYVFLGFDRTITYFWILTIFLITAIVIAGQRGVRSIFSLALSVLIIGKVIIPLIIDGKDPILVASIAGFVMLAIQLYVTNGINRPTTLSILGAAFGVLCSVIFAKVFSDMGKISGFGDENSGFLSLNAPNAISIKNLVVASFILGVLGVVDDATVSQVAVVSELKKNNKGLKRTELFRSAMEVGSSHIGSLMNTLFLAYVASALPLIILMFMHTPDLYEVVNIDLFAEEIIRTAVGSLGLILSIPAATYFAVSFLRKHDLSEEHTHHH